MQSNALEMTPKLSNKFKCTPKCLEISSNPSNPLAASNCAQITQMHSRASQNILKSTQMQSNALKITPKPLNKFKCTQECLKISSNPSNRPAARNNSNAIKSV